MPGLNDKPADAYSTKSHSAQAHSSGQNAESVEPFPIPLFSYIGGRMLLSFEKELEEM
jgi:hypothetical protein